VWAFRCLPTSFGAEHHLHLSAQRNAGLFARADTACVPRELSAVPAARSSDKAFRVKQGLVIGAVLFGAVLGPIAAIISLTSRVNVPLLREQVVQQVSGSVVSPDFMLATADIVVDAWANGRPISVPRLTQVTFANGALDLTVVERSSYAQVDLAEAGLAPKRYQSAWVVYYRAARADGTLVYVNVPMAITVPRTITLSSGENKDVPSISVLRAAPSLEPYIYPLDPTELGNGDVLVPTGWEPVEIADTSQVVTLAQRWVTGYLTDRLSSSASAPLDPQSDKNKDGVDDMLAPPPAALQDQDATAKIGAYRGLGGYSLAPGTVTVLSGPYKATAANTAHTGELLMTISFGALGSAQNAPTLTPVTMTMDLLVKAESLTVLAWGPAGSGASLTPYQNHTVYRAWQPPALGE